MKKIGLLLLLGLGLYLPAGSAETVAGMRVLEGWVREAPPHAVSLAGYLRLVNQGRESHRLVGVSSPQFQGAMMHVTIIEDGVARMRHLDGLDIPAGGEVAFVPGGRHIMLMGPEHELHVGDRIDLVLEFADGGRLDASLPVRKTAPAE